jgi:hypothetical protein
VNKSRLAKIKSAQPENQKLLAAEDAEKTTTKAFEKSQEPLALTNQRFLRLLIRRKSIRRQ